MASAFGDLNGSGPQQIWLDCHYVSYNQGGNYSTWYWEIRYYGNGYGSWTNNTQYWSLSGFAATSGTFTIPQSQAYVSYTVLGSGTFTKVHDANGYLSVSNITAGIDTDHSSIGDGSVTVYPGSAPRIPKPPSVPSSPALTPGPGTITAVWNAPTDNGGSGITGYTVQYSTNSDMSGSLTQAASGTSTTLTGLTFGKTYYVRVLANNAVGSSAYSGISSTFVGIGGRRWDGSNELPFTTAVRWDGTAEVPITVAVRWDGTAEVPLA